MPPASSSSHSPLHGIWRIIPSPMLTELFAQAGLNFQILDCEHGAYDYATLLPDILACERHGCAPIVRVSGADKVEVQRCLDLGARGIVFPQLTTGDDFLRASSWMDYAPDGTRGFNPFVRAGHYGIPPVNSTESARPWLMPIVETLAAAEEIESLVQIGRIDMIYIGAYDLSAQLGCPGKMDDPKLTELIVRIIAACHQAAKPVGLMALSTHAAGLLVARGVQALVHGVDSHRVKQSMVDILRPLQGLHLPASAVPLS